MYSGNMNVLEWWLHNYSLPDRYGDPVLSIFVRSVKYGYLKPLEWLPSKRKLYAICPDSELVCSK